MTIKAQNGGGKIRARFESPQTADGIDVVAVIRSIWPTAASWVDDDGGVIIVLRFSDQASAIDAAFTLRDLCVEMGVEVNWL